MEDCLKLKEGITAARLGILSPNAFQPWRQKGPFRITLHKLTHFAFSMQNGMHYFSLTAVQTVVTNSFLTGTKIEKYGISISMRKSNLHCL